MGAESPTERATEKPQELVAALSFMSNIPWGPTVDLLLLWRKYTKTNQNKKKHQNVPNLYIDFENVNLHGETSLHSSLA